MRHPVTYDSENGFTLIEVLVALAIFAIAGIALLNAQNQNIRTADYLEEKAFAEIIADNLMVEAVTDPSALDPGFTTGETEMAARAYRWRRQVIETNSNGIHRVQVTIFTKDGEQALTTLTALRRAN